MNKVSDSPQGEPANKAEGKDWTLLELLNWTTAYFERAKIENPRLNAELLLSKVCGLERVMLYANFDQAVPAERRTEFRQLVKRRAERFPLQYLLGRAEFYGRAFEVACTVLVPRQETELVVDKCLEKLPGDGTGQTAADVGTGSGILAVTLACERPGLRVLATDVSEEALAVASRNAGLHGVQERVTCLAGNLCEPLPGGGAGKLDLLVSNPPYIPTAVIETLQPEVRDHEPRCALDGGPDGLSVVRELIPRAADCLKPGGWLVLELGEGQAEDASGLIAGCIMLDAETVETLTDAGGCKRVIAARRKADADRSSNR
jgi:release factor glutamine methyltransferase